MAGVAYYTIAGKQVGGHYVGPPSIGIPRRQKKLTSNLFRSWPWPGWAPCSLVSSMPCLAAPASPAPPPLPRSTPPAPTRPTSSSARIQLSAPFPSANRSAGTSSTSRTRRTKRRPEKGRRSYGFADAVYIYQSWRHELFIEPDSRFQIPTKAESAIGGITMSDFHQLHCSDFRECVYPMISYRRCRTVCVVLHRLFSVQGRVRRPVEVDAWRAQHNTW